jgi:RNA polymerase sigma factor (TIGR02999 family)
MDDQESERESQASGGAPVEFCERVGGDRRHLDRVYSAVYEELRRRARKIRGRAGGLQSPTTLVNEAWIKLQRSPHLASLPRAEFVRVAAHAMRQILYEAARSRAAAKRPPRHAAITLDDTVADPRAPAELVAIHAALTDYERLDPRGAEVVELRYFGGFEVSEIAALLGVSEATVHRDWRCARAKLHKRLQGA